MPVASSALPMTGLFLPRIDQLLAYDMLPAQTCPIFHTVINKQKSPDFRRLSFIPKYRIPGCRISLPGQELLSGLSNLLLQHGLSLGRNVQGSGQSVQIAPLHKMIHVHNETGKPVEIVSLFR